MDRNQFIELRAYLKLIAQQLAVISVQTQRGAPLTEAEILDVQKSALRQVNEELYGPNVLEADEDWEPEIETLPAHEAKSP